MSSMFPANIRMPMVSPSDVGEAAASRLRGPLDDTAISYVEGPARYTPRDVADAFAAALHREVVVDVTPYDQWQSIHRKLGFSESAAKSYARMTEVSLADDFENPINPVRGPVSLDDFIMTAVR